MAATTNPWTERMVEMCAQAAEIAEILASELSVVSALTASGPSGAATSGLCNGSAETATTLAEMLRRLASHPPIVEA